MPRSALMRLLFAFLAGCVLLWFTVFVSGILAALPSPAFLQPLLQSQGWPGVTLHSVLLVHLPMCLFAGLFAWLVLRVLKAGGLVFVFALSAPWLIYCFLEAVNYYQEAQFPPSNKLAMLLAWYTWFGRLSVPLGVWLASKVVPTRAPSAA
jgi:hypothetical protein